MLALALLLAAPVPAAAVARDTASVVAWPAQVDSMDGLLLTGALTSTLALMRSDPRLYGHLGRLRWTLHRRSIFHYTLLAGDGLVDLGVMGAFALGGERGRQTALTGVQALMSVALTSLLLKRLFRVPRPNADANQHAWFQGAHADAFPSGHTMAAFATAGVISSAYPSAAYVCYPVAALVGVSVMKRGWHWTTDVLAGAALGAVIGRVAVRVQRHRVQAVPGGVRVEI